jgi:hypothetical protein
LAGRQSVRAPVVQDQKIALGERAEEAREAAVTVGEFEVGEEA